MLHSIGKILKKSTKIASSTKKRLDNEVQKLVKAHKLTIKEGKALTKKIFAVVKVHGNQVRQLVTTELKKDYQKSKPYVKKLARKIGSKAKKRAKSVAKKALKTAKSKTRNLAVRVARKLK